jgi:cytosine/adenosine deaminase-related metal-dependent hydrolase
MFQAMKMFCSLAAVTDVLPGAPIATDAMRAACLGGAKPAGLDKDLGHIRPGMLADLVLLDLADPSFVPFNSAARQLVFTEAGRGVRTVIVDGRVLLDDRKLTTIDERALREEILDIMVEFNRDAAQISDRIMPISAGIIEAVRRSWDEPLPIHRYIGH